MTPCYPETITRALGDRINLPMHIITSKWENPDFLYPDSEPDQSQTLTGSMLDLYQSSDFFRKI